jgi:hypothetical protein
MLPSIRVHSQDVAVDPIESGGYLRRVEADLLVILHHRVVRALALQACEIEQMTDGTALGGGEDVSAGPFVPMGCEIVVHLSKHEGDILHNHVDVIVSSVPVVVIEG